MANQLQEFKSWLLNQRNFRFSWLAKDSKAKAAPQETSQKASQEALGKLPDEISEQLVKAANELPIHPSDQKAVIEALDDAISQWIEHPQSADNSIVILSDPVSSVSRIIAESLDTLRCQKDREAVPITLLDWVERPLKVESLKQKIKNKLDLSGKKEQSNNSQTQNSQTQNSQTQDGQTADKALMVIPNLSWCFLRSADGLDGLDYLQDLIPRNRNHFWVLGCGRVSWDYLKSTIKFDAYCGQTMVLPFLSGEELQTWLKPFVQQFDIRFSDAALHKRLHKQLEKSDSIVDLEAAIEHPIEAISDVNREISTTLKSSLRAVREELLSNESEQEKQSAQQEYFDRLAHISDGVSTIALQILVESLRCEASLGKGSSDSDETAPDETAPDKTDSDEIKPEERDLAKREPEKVLATDAHKTDSPDAKQQKSQHLIASIPKLPTLPNLSQNDLYLLYSLILHGDLHIKALAESLGDAPNIINHQVQILRERKVIEQKGHVLKANPAYYPRIRRELARNNFIIEVP